MKNGITSDESVYSLSSMQEGMLFQELSTPGSNINTEQLICGLHEDINGINLQKAWQRVVERHAILRTSFHWQGHRKPVQKVHRYVSFPWEFEDWRGIPEEEKENRFKEFLEIDRHRDFDISKAPVARLTLFRLQNEDYKLLWSFNHVILDARSFTQVLNEVFILYDAFQEGRDVEFQPAPSYEDYIHWLERRDLNGAETFWREQLRGFTAPTPLFPLRSDMGNNDDEMRCAEVATSLSVEITQVLKDMASQNGFTLNTVVQGAWALLLSRYSGEEDVVFGGVRACRRSTIEGADRTVGLFINTLPLRVQVPSNMSLIPWLKKLRAQHVILRDYEHSPLVEVQKWSDVPPATPLFESIIVFENYDLNTKLQTQGEKWVRRDFQLLEKTKFPITLYGSAGGGLKLKIGYQEAYCNSEYAGQMIEHLKTLLEGMAEDPNRLLTDLPILTEADREKLQMWNDTLMTVPEKATIHQLFEAQVERNSDAIALVCEGNCLTYRELNDRANQLASNLRRLGVGPEVLVGICVERSIEMIVGLFGILKAGGAYVPLDPAYPHERLKFMVSDSQTPVIALQERFLKLFPGMNSQTVVLDRDRVALMGEPEDNVQSGVRAENLAYVIYTSGSTGKPKGVMVEHRNVVNFFIGMDTCIEHNPGDTWLAVTSPSFDISVLEIFWALTRGFRLVIYTGNENGCGSESQEAANERKETEYNKRSIPELIELHNVTHFQCTPSMASLLMMDEKAKSALEQLKVLLIGGETFPASLAEQLQDIVTGDIINMYGPTETTVWSTTYKLKSKQKNIPIGKPIANTEIFIVDKNLKLVSIGIPGELLIGGSGVVRGYLNRPELTAERFVINPFSNNPKDRLYRTGDLACYLPDGNIEFMGRMDYQVKIRGYRIELGEVEAVLNDHSDVRESVVMARELTPGQNSLVAYVIPCKGVGVETNELRNHTKKMLPDYMVPAHIVTLQEFPYTPNKKIDRKALPLPVKTGTVRQVGFEPPRTEIEEAVAEIWADALHLQQVDRNENFFDLGGDSLSGCGIILNIQRTCNVALPLQTIFRAPTVATLAEKLEEVFLKQAETEESISATPESSRPAQSSSTDITVKQPSGKEGFEQPRTQTEKVLADIWSKTLRVDRIGRNDHFFHLGGKSLDAVNLFTKIEGTFGKKLPLSTLLQAPTLKKLASIIDEDALETGWSSLVSIDAEGTNPPLFLVHGAEGNVLLYKDLARYLDTDQPLYGLQSQGLDGSGHFLTQLDDMASHYIEEIRRMQPKGPYYLGGYCLGGIIALEMAQQLRTQGEEVALVAMIETYNVETISMVQLRLLLLVHLLQNVWYHLFNFLSIKNSDRWNFFNEKKMVAKGRLRIRFATWFNTLKRVWHPNDDFRYPHLIIKRVNERAAYAYRPKAYSGRVVVFRPKVWFLGQNDPAFGWGEVVQSGLSVCHLPFYPKSMLVEPFVQVLAKELNAYMDKARTEDVEISRPK